MYSNNTHVLSSSCVYTHPTQRYCLNVSAEATAAMANIGPRQPAHPPPSPRIGKSGPPAQPPPVPPPSWPRVWVGKIPAWNNNAADASHSGSPAGTPVTAKIPAWNNNAADASHSGSPAGTPVTATAGCRPEQTSPSSGDLPRPTRDTPFVARLAWHTQEVAAKRATGIRLREPAPFVETPQLKR
jgi:hypothetical protein